MQPKLQCAAFTDVGKVRTLNEDAFHVDAEHGFAIVADGMGGHKGGEVASLMAIATVCTSLLDEDALQSKDEMQLLLKLGSSIELANKLILEEALDKPELKGMGTTLVATLFRDGQIYLAHVGDSRLYRFRDDRLEQMTKDHSLLQYMLDKGVYASEREALAAGVGSNILTRGLGVVDQIEVDVSDEIFEQEDIYLLCTDGLTGMLSDHRIETLIRQNINDLEMAGQQMLAEALSNGGHDNITLVLVSPLTEDC